VRDTQTLAGSSVPPGYQIILLRMI
jgi:hypothetical protein